MWRDLFMRGVLALGWTALGCGFVAAADAIQPVVVTEKSDGKSVNLKIGQSLELRLTNEVEGAGWEQIELKGAALKAAVARRITTCDEFEPKFAASKPESTVGDYVTRFTGAQAGATIVKVRQMLPGGPKPVATKATKKITEIAITVLVAAADAEPPAVVTEKSDGKTVSLKTGQMLELRLTNDREGAGWEGIEIKGDALAAVQPKRLGNCDEFEPTDKTKERSTIGVYLSRFVGAQTGQAKLIVRHIYPSGPKPIPRLATEEIAEISITIVVQ